MLEDKITIGPILFFLTPRIGDKLPDMLRGCGCFHPDQRTGCVKLSLLLLLLYAHPAKIQAGEPKQIIDLPGELTPAAIEIIDGKLEELGKDPDWDALHAFLDAQPESPVVRYTRASADLQRCAVWDGERGIETLKALRKEAARRGDLVLAARLLLATGRGQLALRHNGPALSSLDTAVAELRRLGDSAGLVEALFVLSSGLINNSRRPRDALKYLNELQVRAARLDMRDYQQLAARLYDEWRKGIDEVDDYFGRARNRLQYFPPSLGIPEDADLVAFVDGVLIMNGDTDDQVSAARPEFVSFDGLLTRKLKLPGESLQMRGSLVDDHGQLWAATNRGLYRYDGKKFTHLYNPALTDEEGNDLTRQLARERGHLSTLEVAIPSNVVNEMKQDPDGNFYLATASGAAVCDRNFKQFKYFTSKNAPLPTSVERIAKTPDGSLVIAWRDAYAVRLPSGAWKKRGFEFPKAAGRQHGKLFGLLVDSLGHAWVHGLGGAQELSGDRVIRYVDRRFSALTRNVNHVLKASDGAYWFASTDGLCRQSGSHCDALNAGRWMPAEWSLDLLEWPAGNVWVSVYQGGLIRIMPPSYRHYGLAEGFRQPVNETIHELDGYLYFTNGEGLTRLDPSTGRIDNFASDAEGIPPGELKISEKLSDGRLALAGPDISEQKAIVLFDGRRGRLVDEHDGLPAQSLISFCENKAGKLEVAYSTGIWQLDLKTLRARPNPDWRVVEGKQVSGFVCAADGSAWVLTPDAVFRLKGDAARRVDLGSVGLRGKPRQLIASTRAGVFVFGQRQIINHRNGAWSQIPVNANSFDFRVRDVVEDDRGLLYFATESGVFVFNGEIWTHLDARDGLVSRTSFQMLVRQDGLWVTGDGGVSRWNWPEQQPPETFLLFGDDACFVNPDGRSLRFQVSNGIEKKGWVQLRGTAGLFELPEKQAGSFMRPAILAGAPPAEDSVKSDSEDLGMKVVRSSRLELSASAGVPFMDDTPDEFSYQYRVDAGPWILASGRKFAFSDLKDGMHRVEIRATDPRLVSDPTPAHWAFVVDTPISPWLPAAFSISAGFLLFFTRRRWIWLLQCLMHRHFHPLDPASFTPQRAASGSNFIGRKEQLETLQGMATDTGGVAVAWGERGTGKHSFMLQLARRLRQRHIHVVEIDLAVATAGGDVAKLVGSMGRILLDVLEADGVHLDSTLIIAGESLVSTPDSLGGDLTAREIQSPPGSSAAGDNPFEVLSRTLWHLEQRAPGERVTFLVDNAEVLSVALDSDAGYGSYLFPFMRSLVQERSCVTMVLAIEGRWFDLSRIYRKLFAFASPLAIDRLSREESARLLAGGLKKQAILSERDLARLADLAGGHPFLLQQIGKRLVDEMNRRRTNVCSGKLVKELSTVLVDEVDSQLQRMFLDLSREEKLVVTAFCEGDRRACKLDEIAALLAQAGGKLLYEEIRRAVLSLAKDGTLLKDGDYFSLQGDLYRSWILAHHSIASVLEESHDYVGHYQLIEKLGAGGMGVVYKARDLVTGDSVALKLLRAELSEKKRSRRRFLREARLGKSIRHPNIVKILDYGEQAGRLYLAMEFVAGKTLSRWARKTGDLTVQKVLEIGSNLLSALAAVHEVGIVHRDVKSDNIMVDSAEGNSIKLMDFGLAVGKDVSRMTRAGSLLGTVAYMSPEQARGKVVDARSDLYSLGVVLYELCAGTPPFSGPDAAVLHAVIYDTPPSLGERAKNVPAELSAYITKLMAKNPDQRQSSAREALDQLNTIAKRLGASGKNVFIGDMADDGRIERGTAHGNSSGTEVTSHALDTLMSQSVLLSSLSTATQESISSLADATHDAARLLLYRISAEVARGSIEGGVLKDCLEQVCDTLAADRGLVALARDDGKFKCVASCNRDVGKIEQLPVLFSLFHQCVGKQSGLLYTAPQGSIEDGMGTAVFAPLWAADRILGAFMVERSGAEARSFDFHSLELMAGVGYLLGLGLERERLYKQVLNQERLAAVGHMLAGVAHDMRSPMAVISGYAELITFEKDPASREKNCAVIVRQVDEMNHMIGNLLAYVRGDTQLNTAEIRAEELAVEIEETFRPQCEPRGIELNITAGGEGPARVDVSRTKRIIYNLGKNAVEALGESGKLEIHIESMGQGLEIRIHDNGPGIPAQVREHMFDPFFTSGKKGGTGLGLAIVSRFTKDQAGSISTHCPDAGGTTMTVKIPNVTSR
jgi:serine/threonine protein kinase/signal transduction histidine kinase/ligand-binding sensor domain-containing protein